MSSDSISGGHSALLNRWLFLLIPVLVLVPSIIWWAIGLRVPARTEGFGSRPVTIDIQDTRVTGAMRVICPQLPCKLEEGTTERVLFTLSLADYPEDKAVDWVASTTETQIVLRDGLIIISAPSWLERSYRATSKWSLETLGFSPWPNR